MRHPVILVLGAGLLLSACGGSPAAVSESSSSANPAGEAVANYCTTVFTDKETAPSDLLLPLEVAAKAHPEIEPFYTKAVDASADLRKGLMDSLAYGGTDEVAGTSTNDMVEMVSNNFDRAIGDLCDTYAPILGFDFVRPTPSSIPAESESAQTLGAPYGVPREVAALVDALVFNGDKSFCSLQESMGYSGGRDIEDFAAELFSAEGKDLSTFSKKEQAPILNYLRTAADYCFSS